MVRFDRKGLAVGMIRVHELAKELGLESKQLLTILNEEGAFVRSASSTVESAVVQRLKAKIGRAPSPSSRSRSGPTVSQLPYGLLGTLST